MTNSKLAVFACIGAMLATADARALPFNPRDLVAGVGQGTLAHYDSVGNFLEYLNSGTGSNEMTGMCSSGRGGPLYATAFNKNNLASFDGQGNLVGLFGSGYSSFPQSCAIDSSCGENVPV